MSFIYFITIVVTAYIFCDLNYLFRTFFTVWSGRIFQKNYSWNETTTIYGLGTFLDCDVSFRSVRLARLVRELDFARYHFYDRTGIYRRSRQHEIKSLQGSTLTVFLDPVPLFTLYKIDTKLFHCMKSEWCVRDFILQRNTPFTSTSQPGVQLKEEKEIMAGSKKNMQQPLLGAAAKLSHVARLVYWDERSLFLEHEIVTIHDDRLRCVLVSRQFALAKDKESTAVLLLNGSPGLNNKPDCPEYVISWLRSMKHSSVKLRK